MVRKRQQAAEADALPAEPQPPQPGETPAAEPATETAPQQGEAPAEQPQGEGTKRPYNPVRSWSEQYVGALRYQKLTDDRMKKIIFRFKLPQGQNKPPEEALAVMRSHKQTAEGQPTGLKFEDTRTHGKVWTIPNDPEGRDLAGTIEFELSKLATKMEAAQPTPA